MKTVTVKKNQSSRAPANGVLPNITHYKQSQINQQKSGIRSILNSPFIQRKVVIGQANDSYEREADTGAERVVNNQPAGPISRVGSLNTGPTAQRQNEESDFEEKEEEAEPVQTKLIQRQAEESGEADEDKEEPVQTKLIQRQGESDENEEEEKPEPVQTKLIQRQNEESGEEEKEEESESIQAKLIQRQSEESGDEEKEEETESVQTKMIQRQSEESGENEKEEESESGQTKLIQRQSEESGGSGGAGQPRSLGKSGSGARRTGVLALREFSCGFAPLQRGVGAHAPGEQPGGCDRLRNGSRRGRRFRARPLEAVPGLFQPRPRPAGRGIVARRGRSQR